MLLPLTMISAILDCVQEAIEVTDRHGNIIYVNPAFCRITGIPFEARTRENIYTISPDGALALALRSGKPVSGYRTKVGGSNAEVISNAVPIVVNQETLGAVVIFQHITDIMKLIDELKRSTSIIRDLSTKFGQVTESKYTFENIVGESTGIKECIKIAALAAKSSSTILLLGESGTGKEVFAHAIHHAGSRKDFPFIAINCAAIPDALLESELFGHVRGAFTGAFKDKIGKFELANSGTLFLDEIGDMNPLLQAKLLRVLQEREFERVGGNRPISIDVRVIAATNRNLKQLVREGRFREDLYYRLNVVEILLPPLRQRTEDLTALTNHLITKLNRKLGRKVTGLTREGIRALHSYQWPGNVRELENVMERVMVSLDSSEITFKDLIPHLGLRYSEPSSHNGEVMALDEMEKQMIEKALTKFGYSVEGKRQAANRLNISLATLYNKMKRYNITVSNI